MKIIAATKNKNKLREFGEILKGFEIISQEEAGIDLDVEETGTTFEENSYLKAKAIYDLTGIAAIADDSGLCVDALGGEPGVYSARYGGEGYDDKGRVTLLLKNMENVPDEKRSARFVCAITLVSGEGIITARGECEGKIDYAPKGTNGFGYDPVFFVEKFGKTMAEITPEEKNEISHRGKALGIFAEKLEKKQYS
ncbi:MAG: XTP/dITP diphosphatase [Clostridia bacterium]|nr:XTP/dITP diphosphatase [Clostridia bacterium]